MSRKSFINAFWGTLITRAIGLWNNQFPVAQASRPESSEAIGVARGDPLQRLGLKSGELRDGPVSGDIHFACATSYLNNARAVVTHSIDDVSEFVQATLDALDKYDVKATVFIETAMKAIPAKARSALWTRLQKSIDNGHEVGAHSRTHRCARPDTPAFCAKAYSKAEVQGARDDILAKTTQPHVWAWAYPYGNCAAYDFIQQKLAEAGFLVARTYPGEEQNLHLVPDLQTFADKPYQAAYTQAVQNKGGIDNTGRSNVAELNTKFDEVLRKGGIYSFVSHPRCLDLGPDKFYEQHLAHIGKRTDVWYVPMGPLYAYKTVAANTQVRPLDRGTARGRFVVYNNLDCQIFNTSITLGFSIPEDLMQPTVQVGGKTLCPWTEGPIDRWNSQYFRREGKTLLVTVQPNSIVEFH